MALLAKPLKDAEPARRSGRPSRAALERLNEHLVDVAQRLFLTKGFDGTSMDELALEARASKRTIYRRYPNKVALFEAVMIRAIERILTQAAPSATGRTVEERLERVVLGLVDLSLREDVLSLLRTVIADGHHFPELANALSISNRERLANVLGRALDEEVVRGELAFVGSIHVAASQLLDLTSVPLLLRALIGRDVGQLRAEAPATVHRAVKLFLHGTQGSIAPSVWGAG